MIDVVYNLLNTLYSLTSSFLSTSELDLIVTSFFSDVLFDSLNIFTLLLPSGFMLFVGYALIKWFLDIV